MSDNRTTVKNKISALNVPSVSNADMNTMLRNYLADNLMFLADVAVYKIYLTTSNITLDFDEVDRIDLERRGGALNLTIANLNDGNVKWVRITKSVSEVITWVNAIDETEIPDNITNLDAVLYMVVNKGGTIYVKAFTNSVLQATETILGVLKIATELEHNALSVTDKVCVPGRLPLSSTAQKGLVEIATEAEHKFLSVTDRVCVPGWLPRGSTIQSGLVEIADSTQIDEGEDTDSGGKDQLVVQPSELLRKVRHKYVKISTSSMTYSVPGDVGRIKVTAPDVTIKLMNGENGDLVYIFNTGTSNLLIIDGVNGGALPITAHSYSICTYLESRWYFGGGITLTI